jgi:hypothetical protein
MLKFDDGYSQKVRVYWNLHKDCYSIQDCKTGKVIAHREALTITDAKFVVRKGGNERVRDEGRKNVHAFIVGRVSIGRGTAAIWDGAKKVTYNPYKHNTFVTVDEETPVTDAHIVTMGQWMGKPSVWAITPDRPTLDTFNQQ